jgi:magnesium transporter
MAEDRDDGAELREPASPAEERLEEILSSEDEEDQLSAFRKVEAALRPEVLDELPEPVERRILAGLTDDEAATVLEHMPPDELVDALQLIDEVRVGAIRESLPDEARTSAELLERYDPETAGGLMTDRMVHLPAAMAVGEAIEQLRGEEHEEHFAAVYVSERDNFVGAVPLRRILLAREATRLGYLVDSETPKLDPHADQEEVVRLFTRRDLRELPVVSPAGRLLGVIAVDDVLEAAEEEGTEDMLLMAGSAEEEPAYNTLVQKAARRLPWLGVTLVGGIACSWIMSRFGASIEQMVALAFFVPVIISMAGSVALQCSTAMVRSMATGEFDMVSVGRQVFREVAVGMMLGVACGLVAGAAAAVFQGGALMGVVVGASMVASVAVAALSGSLIPHLVDRCGVDPAIASGPFITTLNDLLGVTIYLVMASVMVSTYGVPG